MLSKTGGKANWVKYNNQQVSDDLVPISNSTVPISKPAASRTCAADVWQYVASFYTLNIRLPAFECVSTSICGGNRKQEIG